MTQLAKKENLTSLEILKEINIFRKKERKKELRHDTLLGIIRSEFKEEISLQEILESNYVNRGKEYPMFILSFGQAKQILIRESKFVRKAVIKYIENLEKELNKLPTMSKMEMIVEIAQSQVETNKRIDRLENTITIDSAKARVLQRKVGRRVIERIEKLEKIDSFGIKFLGITEWEKKVSRKLFANIYRDIKNKFAVASYRDIRVVDYDKTIQFIQNWIEDSELLEDVK